MIFKVAWRNIWRSKVRSFIVIGSIAVGIWAGLLIIGFSFGMNNERTASAIGTTIGHAQIHSTAFDIEPLSGAVLGDDVAVDELREEVEHLPFVAGTAQRTVLQGMINSAKSARAVRIMGVWPEDERAQTTLPVSLVEGDFFESEGRNRLVIGEKLANRLGLKLRSKVVLTFQDTEGTLSRASFRVSGIYKTLNATWDEFHLYVHHEDLEKTLSAPLVHEVLVRFTETVDTDEKTVELAAVLPNGMSLKSWKQVNPELGFADDMMAIMLVLVLGIIMMALLFGIINNMLMAILERRRELGMLMAVGLNKRKLFLMILLETLILGFVGGPIGIVLGDLSTRIMMRIGVDLTSKKEGLAELGVQSIIYPEIVPEYYIIIAIMVVTTALIASILPAVRALKLNPVEAIRGQ
ncbi:MAG: FtsX-like permease family protein [Schleiferiaceae bacterium]|nr:FtsX-like permease family protein [Schleiferiaceae bacterium]